MAEQDGMGGFSCCSCFQMEFGSSVADSHYFPAGGEADEEGDDEVANLAIIVNSFVR